MKKENCAFCHPDYSRSRHLKAFGLPSELNYYVVQETDNFLVKPDILPVNTDGRHFLVFPKTHNYNFASFGGESHIVDELGRLVYQLEQRFGPLVIFEHGGIKDGKGPQSIYHAHFHAIGGLEGFDIVQYMSDMVSGGLSSEEIYPHRILPAPNYDFLSNLHQRFNGHPYLYVEQGNWALYAEDPGDNMKSQVTQRSMHRLFSGVELDWKKISENEEFARESARRLANIYALCMRGEYMPYRF